MFEPQVDRLVQMKVVSTQGLQGQDLDAHIHMHKVCLQTQEKRPTDTHITSQFDPLITSSHPLSILFFRSHVYIYISGWIGIYIYMYFM